MKRASGATPARVRTVHAVREDHRLDERHQVHDPQPVDVPEGRARRSHGTWPRRRRTSETKGGKSSFQSSTVPRSAFSKIAALLSVLTATTRFAPTMPTRCWLAPEIPIAM